MNGYVSAPRLALAIAHTATPNSDDHHKDTRLYTASQPSRKTYIETSENKVKIETKDK